MLARVTPRALATLPGVFFVTPTKKGAGKGSSSKGGAGKGTGRKEEVDPELAGSNVFSVGEGVLLKWLSYHLEQANRVRTSTPLLVYGSRTEESVRTTSLIFYYEVYAVQENFVRYF